MIANKQQITQHPQARNQIRRDIRRLRQQLTSQQQQQASSDIAEKLSQNPHIKNANSIAIYLANDGELNLSYFVDWCWQHNKQVYLPVMHPFCPGYLLFLHYQPNTELFTNTYGIPEPKLDVRKVLPINQLDVVITPLVAFDPQGNRIGMGGGFYDRTLANWYKECGLEQAQTHTSVFTQKPYPIGVAHNCQKVAHIPIEQWDIPLPEILTPN